MEHRAESCKEVLELLSDYLDLELSPRACEQIENHLAGCAPCVEFAASLRRTVELCKGYTPATMPRPLSDQARRDLENAWKKMLAGSR